ncbi:MAG: hypothetical protein KJN89_13070 [Gammaproteobacteria bacterium]|nr:hypothetical protein [Gammaproteobacteria bacterium]MBT8133463.1 hypothetical protein [Gammaproteobacteria bacterium]NNJ51300.1 hypothetical protein [Gammaproteobacteria bacterium]
MKKYLLLLSAVTISACSTMHSSDPDSLYFQIPAGSTLSLNQKLTIPGNDTHAVVQQGKEIKDRDKNEYAINCRVDVKEFGVRTLEPEDFKVTRTEDGQNWISHPSIMRFYTEVYLSSSRGTDIIKMVCQEYGSQNDRNFTVAEMQQALGDILTFKFATEK